MSRKDDDLDLTVQTLIDLDEPEALLATLAREAKRRKGQRWQRLAFVLMEAEAQLMGADKPAGPDFRPPAEPPAAA